MKTVLNKGEGNWFGKHCKTLLRGTGLILTGIAVGFLLLFAAFAIPDEPVFQHVRESLNTLQAEGDWPTIGWDNAGLDNYTDSWMLNIACQPALGGVVDAAVYIYHGTDDFIDSQVEKLAEYVTARETGVTPPTLIRMPYSRYWHGYLVFLRPALVFMNYNEIRIANMFLQFGLIVWLLYTALRKVGRKYMLAIAAAIVFLTPAIMPLSMQNATVFYITLVTLIVLLNHDEWLRKGDRYLLFFCLVGMVTSYMDFLTYPLVTLGLPLITMLLLEKSCHTSDSVRITLHCIPAWGAGYGLMWAGKWGFGSLLVGKNLLRDAVHSIRFRAGDKLNTAYDSFSRILPVEKNLSVMFSSVYLWVCILILVALALMLLTRKASIKKTDATRHIPSLAIIAVTPFCWYVAAANHSFMHPSFTHRILAITVFAILCILLSLMEFRFEKEPITCN